MGVEPTEDIFMPPNGFEVREAHRDSSAPVCGVYSIIPLSVNGEGDKRGKGLTPYFP